MPRFFGLISWMVAGALVGGCRAHRPSTPAAPPATRPLAANSPFARPLLDVRRGTGSFPLAPGSIESPRDLEARLREGYLQRLDPAREQEMVKVQGSWPVLSLLKVDLSDSRMKPSYQPAEFGKDASHQKELRIRRLEYRADPLHYRIASARGLLTADEADLAILHEPEKGSGLILAGADRGTIEFQASIEDLNKMMLLLPVSGRGLTLLRVQLALASPESNTLQGELDLRARYLLLPVTLRLRGQVTADEKGSLVYSHLSATGYDPGGLLAAAFLAPRLKKLDGQTQPVLAFMDSRTRVREIRFAVDEGLFLHVEFGRD